MESMPTKREVAQFAGKKGVSMAAGAGQKFGAKILAKEVAKRGAPKLAARVAMKGARVATCLPVAIASGAGEFAGYAVCKVAKVKNKHVKRISTVTGAAGGGAIAGGIVGGPIGAVAGAGIGVVGWGIGQIFDLIVDAIADDDDE